MARLAIVALLLCVVFLAACNDEAAEPEPSPAAAVATPSPVATVAPPRSVLDYATAGPYGAGVISRTLERAATTTGEPRLLDLVIWYPAPDKSPAGLDAEFFATPNAPGASGGPFPVVIFSHGSGGLPTGSSFLTSHLATQGFVVISTSHPGNTARDCFPCLSMTGFTDSALNRPDDVAAILDHLEILTSERGSPLLGLLDGWRTAVAGHSFGGYTAVVAASRDTRLRAVLALAPWEFFGQLREPAAALATPILIMAGDRDDVTPYRTALDLFQTIPGATPRYLATLAGGGHFSFSTACFGLIAGCRPGDLAHDRATELVKGYATAFLRAQLLGDRAAAAALAASVSPAEVTVQQVGAGG